MPAFRQAPDERSPDETCRACYQQLDGYISPLTNDIWCLFLVFSVSPLCYAIQDRFETRISDSRPILHHSQQRTQKIKRVSDDYENERMGG